MVSKRIPDRTHDHRVPRLPQNPVAYSQNRRSKWDCSGHLICFVNPCVPLLFDSFGSQLWLLKNRLLLFSAETIAGLSEEHVNGVLQICTWRRLTECRVLRLKAGREAEPNGRASGRLSVEVRGVSSAFTTVPTPATP